MRVVIPFDSRLMEDAEYLISTMIYAMEQRDDACVFDAITNEVNDNIRLAALDDEARYAEEQRLADIVSNAWRSLAIHIEPLLADGIIGDSVYIEGVSRLGKDTILDIIPVDGYEEADHNTV